MRILGAVYCAPGCKRCSRVSKCSGRKGGEVVVRGGGGGGGGRRRRYGGDGSLENLHAMVTGVSHDHEPVAVDGDAAIRLDELPVA
jgi:hypothetical protein